MNHNYPGIPPVLRPTATPFSMCNPVPLDGTSLFHSQMFGQPPPAYPMHYAFYPGSSFLAQVPGIGHVGLQSTAVVQQHAPRPQYVPPFLAVDHRPVIDPKLISFKERAKKCGINIEPVAEKTEMVDFNEKSSTPVHGSVTPFHNAVDSSQNNVPFYYAESSTNADSIDPNCLSSSEFSTDVKSICVETPHSSEEASLGRQSLSNLDSNEDADSMQSFHSVYPSFEQRSCNTSAISEFTAAAERWRSSEQSKDASCQTPVVMTISACVGTTSKFFVDASTNTDLSTSKKYKCIDASTNTEKHDLNLRENIQEMVTVMATNKDKIHGDCKALTEPSGLKMYIASNSYEHNVHAKIDEGLGTASGLRTASDNKPYFHAPVVKPDAVPSAYVDCTMESLLHHRLDHRSRLLDECESSESSMYSMGRTSNAVPSSSEKSYKPLPPGLTHITGCHLGASKDLTCCENKSDNGMRTQVNSYQVTGHLQTKDILQEALNSRSVADADRSVLNDDVYYSDEEDSDNSAAIVSDQQSSHSKNSPCIEGTISTPGTEYQHTILSMDEQQLINKMIMQMIIANPSLASCSPLLLRELAFRYLISSNHAAPAAATAAALPVEQQIQHSLHQMQRVAAENQGACGLSESLSVQTSEKSATVDDYSGAKSKSSFGQDTMQERLLFVDFQDKHRQRFGCDSSEHSYVDRENIFCPSVGSARDDLSEYESFTLENMTLGRGRSLSSSNQSTDTNRKVKPRGRGRGQRPGVQNVEGGLRCFRLSDEVLPGNMNCQSMKSTTPLHPPAAAMNKPTVMVNKQTSLTGASSYEQTRAKLHCSEDWDEEEDRYAPRVFTVDSNFFKTSKNS